MRTRIKLCGFKTPELVQAAVTAGADAIGFVLYPPSKRYVSLAFAAELAKCIPAFVESVALLVNPTVAEVETVLETVKPSLLQFHGQESPEFCAQFNHPYLKAVAVQPGFNLLKFSLLYKSARAILLDTPSTGHGGSGQTFDWQLLNTLNDAHPPAVLSGGLTPQNVATAIRALRPYAVDVSSGIESAPGIKSAELIQQFCLAVRQADNN
jgi:phosphoribosylanthranilate isomerase